MSDTATAEWTSPDGGHWRRDFRLGEWLPAPVTGSFATWLLPRLEEGFRAAVENDFGVTLRLPLHVVVNGWYFTNEGAFDGTSRAFVRRPRQMLAWSTAMATVHTRPERGVRVMAEPGQRAYDDLLPRHREVIARVAREVAEAEPARVVALVDELARSAGTLMYPMVELLGFAGKAEFALATFHSKHLRPAIGGSHIDLLVGLVEPSALCAHAVTSIDWVQPTAGESGQTVAAPRQPDPELHARRTTAEHAAREALAGSPKRLARFEQTLAIAQRYVPVREQMALDFTEAWPTLRAGVTAVGAHLAERSVLEVPDDIFHLEYAEIEAAIQGASADLRDVVTTRKAVRAAAAAIEVPLAIGRPSGRFRRIDKVASVYRAPIVVSDHDASLVVTGFPSSAGQATGPVRIVRGPDEFDRLQPGDVLVAPITAPAWTPLFALAAAVVTDGGSVFAHASVIAREYGIPAVVATGDATTRLRDGQRVEVNGSTGTVHVL